jgi:hypothetical protein
LRCGDKTGHITKAGTLCQQPIGPGAKGCIWYGKTPEEKSALALKGAVASRLKTIATLPADTAQPVLDSPAAVRAELASTIHDTRTGRLDHRVAMVVIAGINAALKLAELEVAAQIGDLERRFRLRRA